MEQLNAFQYQMAGMLQLNQFDPLDVALVPSQMKASLGVSLAQKATTILFQENSVKSVHCIHILMLKEWSVYHMIRYRMTK